MLVGPKCYQIEAHNNINISFGSYSYEIAAAYTFLCNINFTAFNNMCEVDPYYVYLKLTYHIPLPCHHCGQIHGLVHRSTSRCAAQHNQERSTSYKVHWPAELERCYQLEGIYIINGTIINICPHIWQNVLPDLWPTCQRRLQENVSYQQTETIWVLIIELLYVTNSEGALNWHSPQQYG